LPYALHDTFIVFVIVLLSSFIL